MPDPAAPMERASGARPGVRILLIGACLSLASGLVPASLPLGPTHLAAPAAAQPSPTSPPDGPQPGRAPDDPEAVRSQADEILARDEFQGPGESGETIVGRIRRWLADRIPDFEGPDVGSGPSEGLAFVIVGVIVVGALAAVAWTLTGARRSRRSREAEDSSIDVTPMRSTEEWTEEAERCLRAGDHRGAVRARYRALTTTLARRGLVADTPGRTAGEQRVDVTERAPELTPSFDAVASLFEQVWYGAAPVGPTESRSAQELADRVLAAAPRRAESPDEPEDDR